MPTLLSPAAALDLFGEPFRAPTRRERQRVAPQRRPAPSRPPPSQASPDPAPPPPAPTPALDGRLRAAAPPVLRSSRSRSAGLLGLHPQLWCGNELGQAGARCLPSGFPQLDAELPGGGWPTRAVTELLLAQAGVEWRLLAPALAPACAGGRRLLLIGPPHAPHPRGLAAWGLRPEQLLWLDATEAPQRLWALEQALKADADELAALLAWLPGLRAPQLRRLQTLAARSRAPVFVLHPGRPDQATAAPLRLQIAPGRRWDLLELRLLKRRGAPPAEPLLQLQAAAPTLRAVLPLPPTAGAGEAAATAATAAALQALREPAARLAQGA